MNSIIIPTLVSTLVTFQTLINPNQTLQPTNTPQPDTKPLTEIEYSLSNRHASSFVNEVFSDNILLTLAYMNLSVKKGDVILWDKLRSPAQYSFILKPNETFAFHDKVYDKYKSSVVATTNAHFNSAEGFKSDGWLVGDGVCHLASFMHVAALYAGLQVEAPTNHNFAAIPEVLREYGTSIYYDPNNQTKSERENLYITNSLNTPIKFVITHYQNSLKISVEKV